MTRAPSRRSLVALGTAVAAAAAMTLPVSALATFPGRNGKIAFVRNGDIWAINENGTGLQQITTNPAPDQNPAWNADGTQIVFTRWRNGNWDVFRYVVDGPNPPVALTDTDASEYTPAFSPDGTRIAFARVSAQNAMFTDLRIMSAGGQDDRFVAATGYHPEWSPDGSVIAFDWGTDNANVELIDPDGTNRRSFPGANDGVPMNIEYSPSWAPTGQRVVFATVRVRENPGDTGVQEIRTTNLSAQQNLLASSPLGEPGPEDPAWSPDGNRVAYVVAGQVRTFDTAGRNGVTVTRTGVSSTEPAWQPLKQLNPAPSVSSLSPASVALGSGAITLIVNGSGFVADSRVRLNGEDRPTTVVSASRLLAELPASDLDVAGEARVTVSSPAPGGGVSASRVLTIQGPPAVAPPRVLAPPAVSGSPRVGELLSCSTGTWSNAPTGFTFAWLRMGVPIPGANAAGHQVVAADAARGLACRVEATNAGGTSSAVSDEVLVAAELPAVTPPVVTPPVIVGGGATVTPPATPPPPAVAKRKTGLIGVGAPSAGRRGSPLRLRATFSGVPAGRVVLQRRVKGRFVNVSSLVARTSRVTLVFTPPRTGLQILRVRYASAGVQRVSRTIVIRVRPPL